MENVFRIGFNRLTSLRFFRGPSSLFDFGAGSILDFPMFMFSECVMNMLYIWLIFSYVPSGAYLISSTEVLSSPFCFVIACFVYCLFNCLFFQWYLQLLTALNMATDWFRFCIMFVISFVSASFWFLISFLIFFRV